MHTISRCNSIGNFSHTGKIATFQTLKNKLDELTDMNNPDEIPSRFLESPSVVTSIQFIWYLYDASKSSSDVNESWYRKFTKKNSSGYHLPPILDALVLNMRRALMFFHQYLFNIFSGLFFFVYCVCVKRKTLCNYLCSSFYSSSCDSASLIRNIGKFGAKNYFTDHRTANTIHGFRDSVPVLKMQGCY